ncbi:hypothetical protein [Parvibium lacunae]|uniref:Exonuclease domain-containing protein n=1 Tax=Parvibium lacunae TaxID=1888893 RepID=A0A368L1R3_9BURK|nr:hypothetical protein [Parvibium lacunae]RCS57052.1 hypothetical protein DU000_09605 [Parvibium lacunae]
MNALNTPTGSLPPILDLEASGFGAGSYPIEVGCILGDGRSYCALISPAPGWTHWNDAAESTHGISRELLLTHGKDPVVITTELNSLLRGQTVYSDAWLYDYAWLAKLYEEAGQQPSFRLESLQRLLSESQIQAWPPAVTQAQQRLNIQRHRASSDARIQQAALATLLGLQ